MARAIADKAKAGFCEGIQRVCRTYGVLLVMDEMATGFGRRGRLLVTIADAHTMFFPRRWF